MPQARLLVKRKYPGAVPGTLRHNIDSEALRLNLLIVFEMWDKSGDDVRSCDVAGGVFMCGLLVCALHRPLTLRMPPPPLSPQRVDLTELHNGLLSCGWNMSREDLRRGLRAVSHRANPNDEVLFEEFPKLLLRLCNGDYEQAWERVVALSELDDTETTQGADADKLDHTAVTSRRVHLAKMDGQGRPLISPHISRRAKLARQSKCRRYVAVCCDTLWWVGGRARGACAPVCWCSVSVCDMSGGRACVLITGWCCVRFLLSAPVVCSFVFGLWVGLGVTFYSNQNPWTAAQAFYYLVQSGARNVCASGSPIALLSHTTPLSGPLQACPSALVPCLKQTICHAS